MRVNSHNVSPFVHIDVSFGLLGLWTSQVFGNWEVLQEEGRAGRTVGLMKIHKVLETNIGDGVAGENQGISVEIQTERKSQVEALCIMTLILNHNYNHRINLEEKKRRMAYVCSLPISFLQRMLVGVTRMDRSQDCHSRH